MFNQQLHSDIIELLNQYSESLDTEFIVSPPLNTYKAFCEAIELRDSINELKQLKILFTQKEFIEILQEFIEILHPPTRLEEDAKKELQESFRTLFNQRKTLYRNTILSSPQNKTNHLYLAIAARLFTADELEQFTFEQDEQQARTLPGILVNQLIDENSGWIAEHNTYSSGYFHIRDYVELLNSLLLPQAEHFLRKMSWIGNHYYDLETSHYRTIATQLQPHYFSLFLKNIFRHREQRHIKNKLLVILSCFYEHTVYEEIKKELLTTILATFPVEELLAFFLTRQDSLQEIRMVLECIPVDNLLGILTKKMPKIGINDSLLFLIAENEEKIARRSEDPQKEEARAYLLLILSFLPKEQHIDAFFSLKEFRDVFDCWTKKTLIGTALSKNLSIFGVMLDSLWRDNTKLYHALESFTQIESLQYNKKECDTFFSTFIEKGAPDLFRATLERLTPEQQLTLIQNRGALHIAIRARKLEMLQILLDFIPIEKRLTVLQLGERTALYLAAIDHKEPELLNKILDSLTETQREKVEGAIAIIHPARVKISTMSIFSSDQSKSSQSKSSKEVVDSDSDYDDINWEI